MVPGYPNYEVSTRGDLMGPYGRVDPENVIGSKAYVLYSTTGVQVLMRPSELIQRAFPDIPDHEAMFWDRVLRTEAMVQKDIVEIEAYYIKRTRQLYTELAQVRKANSEKDT